MNRWIATLVIGCAASAFGCNDDTSTRPPGPDPDSFWEPLRFCMAGASLVDTLLVYNLGEGALEWSPQHVPSGSDGLGADITLAPGHGLALAWRWSPTGTYPVVDSLVVSTNDPARPRAMVLFYRQDPAVVDPRPLPPLAPLLGFPPDGAEFGAEADTIEVGWSYEDACSGGAEYILQIATDPGFNHPVFSMALPVAGATLVIEPKDRGSTVYWRVQTRALEGFLGPYSPVWRWTVR